MNESIDRSRPMRSPWLSVAPHRWSGERSCLVGPFSAEGIARPFEHYVVNWGGFETTPSAVRQLADGWYIVVPQRPS